MNCKPGDIARIIEQGRNRDALVRVLDDLECDPGVWRCEALQTVVAYRLNWPVGSFPAGTILWGPDANLRPIRDPGDDAQDETLSWLPVPSTEKEAA